MTIEIERKFLVDQQNISDVIALAETSRMIHQGYLYASETKSIRVRLWIVGHQHGATMTIKGPKISSMSVKFDYPIPYDDALHLLTMCEHVLYKVRHTVVDDHEQTWDVDVFDGLNKGLIVAEIKMSTTGQPVDLPAWVGREVTHDRAYANAVLVRQKASTK